MPESHNLHCEGESALLALPIPFNGTFHLIQIRYVLHEPLITCRQAHLEVLALSEVLERGNVPSCLVDEVSVDGVTLHNRHGINLTS